MKEESETGTDMAKKRSVKRVKRVSPLSYVFGVFVVAVIFAGVFIVFSKQEKKEIEGDRILGTVDNNVETVEAEGYAVSSDSKLATETGIKILENGGNAVDAAIAMSYVLSVVEPNATGLGGGGCMLIYNPAEQSYQFYDFGAEASQSGFSWKILVPGMVSGLEQLLEDYGTMERSELMEDAISYCDGFEINSVLANRIKRASGLLGTDSVFYKNGEWLTEGDTLVQKELKETLIKIREGGAEEFYFGSIAQAICEETGMKMTDLAAYKTIVKEPVTGTYQDGEIIAAPDPYSGVTLIQMLKMFEALDTDSANTDNEGYLQDLQEVTVASHSDRLKHVYDYRFGQELDLQEFATDTYINQLLDADFADCEFEEESEDTTGFTIIDKGGMIVASTSTLSSFFGDKTEVAGFYMNNTGVNFGEGVNASAAGKRPRTHISPVIIRTEDEVMAAASPGGNVIVKVMATVLDDIWHHDVEPQKAVDKRRVLYKTQNVIHYEIGYDTEAFADVSSSGYTTIASSDHAYFGNISLVGFNRKDGFYAVSDMHRKGYGQAAN